MPPSSREIRETLLVQESQSLKIVQMDNPIINALVPHVSGSVQRRLTLDTYGPSYLPVGIIVLYTLEHGSEIEISRHAITSISKAQFVSWFAEATAWLDRQLKAKGL